MQADAARPMLPAVDLKQMRGTPMADPNSNPRQTSRKPGTSSGASSSGDLPNDPALTRRDPHDWKTGDEPMTAAQRSYLETLTREAGEDFDADVSFTKAEAALRIEELQRKTGRGQPKAG
jgi:hypothetical protein